MAQNVMTRIFQLKNERCKVHCPMTDCPGKYDCITLFSKMECHEKMRFISLLNEVVVTNCPKLTSLRNAIFDLLTLKCPSCYVPVDPNPDACAAVMCLSCGKHYCNYCFQGFDDRGEAHTHASTHNPNVVAESRDAFLPPEIITVGHQEYRRSKIDKFVVMALASSDFGGISGTEIPLALISSAAELLAMNICLFRVWKAALSTLQGDQTGASGETSILEGSGILPVTERCNSYKGAVLLYNAVVSKNSVAVEQVLQSFKSEIEVNYVDPVLGIPLVAAAILSHDFALAMKLFDLGADPLVVNRQGRNSIYLAIEIGAIEILKRFPDLDLNAPVTQEVHLYKPIHVAARYNQGTVIQYLSGKVDPNSQEGEHGYTALSLALVLGHEWAARELLSIGADPLIPSTNGRTSMFIAVEKGVTEFIQVVISKGIVSVNAPVIKQPGNLLAIHVAACHKQPHIVSLLIDLGADPNAIEPSNGYSPLSVAIAGGCVSSAIELIRRGANVYLPCRLGRFPMFLAVEKGCTDAVLALLSVGVSINSPATLETSAYRPLHIAVLHSQNHMIAKLLDLGADKDIMAGDLLISPLLMAVVMTNEWAVSKLVERGANVHVTSREGRSALYYACEKGSGAILTTLLLSRKLDVNAPATGDPGRATCLHLAAVFNKPSLIHQLIELGAKITVTDGYGKTPLQVAEARNSQAAVGVLTSYSRLLEQNSIQIQIQNQSGR